MDLKLLMEATRALLLAGATAYATITPPLTAEACAGCHLDGATSYCSWSDGGGASWCGWVPYGCGDDGTDVCYSCAPRGGCIN
jgi:hypothetical protein